MRDASFPASPFQLLLMLAASSHIVSIQFASNPIRCSASGDSGMCSPTMNRSGKDPRIVSVIRRAISGGIECAESTRTPSTL